MGKRGKIRFMMLKLGKHPSINGGFWENHRTVAGGLKTTMFDYTTG
jgi:hypothetical protein